MRRYHNCNQKSKSKYTDCNGQKKKDRTTINDLQNTQRKPNIEQHEPKTGGEVNFNDLQIRLFFVLLIFQFVYIVSLLCMYSLYFVYLLKNTGTLI